MTARSSAFPPVGLTILLAVALVLPSVGGCGSSTTNVVGPSGNKCQVSAAASASAYPAGGGAGRIDVSTDRQCSWTAVSDSAWLSFTSPASGQGTGNVTFSIAANPAAAVRSARVRVNDHQVHITEDAAPCRFQLDRSSYAAPAAGASGAVTVTTLAECAWSVSPGEAWVRVEDAGGTGNGRVRFTVTANAGPARSTRLSVAGLGFSVDQASGEAPPAPAPPPSPTPAPPLPPPAPTPPPSPAPPPPAPPPAPACRYAISPTSQSLPGSGGSVRVSVSTSAECRWTADSEASWLTVDGQGGTGSGSLTVVAAANTAPDSRTGWVTIAGQAFTVTQDGGLAAEVGTAGDTSHISGSCPSVTFVVEGPPPREVSPAARTTVFTSGRTEFQEGSCTDVRDGSRVEVTGVLDSQGRLAASRVQIVRKAK